MNWFSRKLCQLPAESLLDIFQKGAFESQTMRHFLTESVCVKRFKGSWRLKPVKLASITTKLSLNSDLWANMRLLGEQGISQTPEHPRHLSFPLPPHPPLPLDQSRRAGLNPLSVFLASHAHCHSSSRGPLHLSRNYPTV